MKLSGKSFVIKSGLYCNVIVFATMMANVVVLVKVVVVVVVLVIIVIIVIVVVISYLRRGMQLK